LCISTLAFSKTYGWVDLAPLRDLPSTKLAAPRVAAIATKTIAGDTAKVNRSKEKYTYSNEQITPKGYHYRETGYVINDKVDFRVIIIEKNGDALVILKSKATPGMIKMLREKYGYSFPSMDIFTKMSPPPPAPPAPKAPHGPNEPNVKGFSPPVVAPADPSTPAAPGKLQVAPPPPMAPFMPPTNGFSGLNKYMAKYTRFPKSAFDKKLTGSVIESFTIGSDGKISNVAFIKGIGSGCDEEVTRALKSFDGTIDAKPGTYKLAVTFTGYGLAAPEPASENLGNDPFFAGEVVLVFYPKS
jgi:hypothetical protein